MEIYVKINNVESKLSLFSDEEIEFNKNIEEISSALDEHSFYASG